MPANDSPNRLDSDLPDVNPLPTVRSHEVNDRFEYGVAFRMGFIGVGQGGGRIAETFYKLGYGRVGLINGCLEDLGSLSPEILRLDLGTGGAGKDPAKGLSQVEGKDELIWDLLTRAVGKKPEYIMVCASLGGGTGSGATPKIIEVARRYLTECGADPARVGVVISLPERHDGPTVCRNAVHAFDKIFKLAPSPMVIIDNTRIESQFQSRGQPLGFGQLFNTCNQQVAKLFHLFNRLAVQRSELMTFDRADYATLLDAGIVVFGASAIGEFSSPADISEAVRKQLSDTLLAQVDMSKGKRAGCIFVGSRKILDETPLEFFGGGFHMLNRLLADGSMVHRGVYVGNSDDLRCYTMVGQLPPPLERLKELASEAAIRTDGIASYLGV